MNFELKKRKLAEIEAKKSKPLKITETGEATINNIVKNISNVGKTHHTSVQPVTIERKKLKLDY